MRVKRSFPAREVSAYPLALVIRSRVLNFYGSFTFSDENAGHGIPASFDLLLSIDDRNYVIHEDDKHLFIPVDRWPDTQHQIEFRVIDARGNIHHVALQGTFSLGGLENMSTGVSSERVKQTMAKYEELFVSIDQGFAIIQLLYDDVGTPRDYFIDEANPALERLTGFKNITGKRISELLPEAPAQWFTTLGQVVSSQVPARFTTKAVELGGAWYDIYTFPMGDPSLKKLGILFTDITDRIQSEQELRDKQLKLDIAQREGRVGIWTYDPTTGYGMTSREWMDLIGHPETPENWSLKTFLSLVEPADVPLIRRAFENARAQHVVEVEFRIKHPERRHLWFLIRGAYVQGKAGAPDALIGSIIDITDRKLFEEQKDQFIAMASHELKTPVTSIRAYAEIIQRFLPGVESTMMDRLVHQIDRLTRLINDLLDATRINSGGLVLEYERFNLNLLLRDRVEEIERTTSHKLILQTQEIPEIVADKGRIGQVVTNLLSNAVKYSPAGSAVIISSSGTREYVMVSVRDFGMGLPSHAIPRIFDRFYRESNVRRNTIPGLGLGLFIASEIIQRHHGKIGVRSKLGEGSEFYFTLPLNAQNHPTRLANDE